MISLHRITSYNVCYTKLLRWTKCKNCNEIIYTKEIERNLNVCPKCDYHFRISARERIALVLDEGSFVEMDASMQSTDFLDFKA